MITWVPVLSEDDVSKPLCEAVYDRHHLVTARHRQATARTEVVLNVDYSQDIALGGYYSPGHGCASSRAWAVHGIASAASRVRLSKDRP